MTMRALRITAHDGPLAVTVEDVAPPDRAAAVADGTSIVVDVRAAGVSFPDVLLSRGSYQLKPPLPFTPGLEVAGVVVAAPDDAAVAVGDRVTGLLPYGGLADEVVVPLDAVAPLPQAVDFAQGAALVVNYRTVVFALAHRAHMEEGDWVMVHGAAGGIGTAAVQVARALGGTAVAVVPDDERADVARRAGADHVIVGDDWATQVATLRPGGVDVVIDPIGGEIFSASLRLLAPDGRLVVIGFAGGEIPTVGVNRVLFRNASVVGAALGAYLEKRPEAGAGIAARVNRLAESAAIQPLIGARYPLERAAEALDRLERKGAVGKLVVEL
jgi:NADPH2:quinone reductase